MKLDKSDRRLLIWTGVVLLPILFVLSALPSEDDQDSRIPSSYSAQNHGAKAAYLLLKEEGFNVERWESPPDQLPRAAAHTVLVLAGPIRAAMKEEKDAVQLFLSRGGTVLCTGYWSSTFVPQPDAVLEPLPDAVWKEYKPQALTLLTRAGAIKMSPDSTWGDAHPEQLVHYANDNKGIVVSYRIGAGQVIWWAADTPLVNVGIKEAGNLGLLLNSLGNSKDVHILWDEYFHAYQGSGTNYFALPPVWAGLAQLGLAFIALLLTYARRNTPIRALNEPSRLSPLEFVSTLGSLYQRANATRTALESPYNRFRFMLTRRLGLRIDSSSAELVRAAGVRLAYRDPDLEATLNEIENRLGDFDVNEEQVLSLTQRLNRHAHNMKLIVSEEQEKA